MDEFKKNKQNSWKKLYQDEFSDFSAKMVDDEWIQCLCVFLLCTSGWRATHQKTATCGGKWRTWRRPTGENHKHATWRTLMLSCTPVASHLFACFCCACVQTSSLWTVYMQLWENYRRNAGTHPALFVSSVIITITNVLLSRVRMGAWVRALGAEVGVCLSVCASVCGSLSLLLKLHPNSSFHRIKRQPPQPLPPSPFFPITQIHTDTHTDEHVESPHGWKMTRRKLANVSQRYRKHTKKCHVQISSTSALN